jgi:hypothetical protein
MSLHLELPTYSPPPEYIDVCGQTWRFTSRAVAALRFSGARTKLHLKGLIIRVSSFDGLEDGIYTIDYYDTELKITATGDRVKVDKAYPS